MIAATNKSEPIRRNILTSTRTSALLLAAISACALATAFPKLDWGWIAPLALAGLFRSWSLLPARSAALTGFVSGCIFFALTFSWFSETAGALLGSLGFITVAGPAAIESVWWALAAAATSFAFARAPRAFTPLAAAAAFTVCEWLRSIGFMGAPLAQIGYTQVDGPLAPLAAFGGSYVVTFAVAFIGASIAQCSLDQRRIRPAAYGVIALAAVVVAAWYAWPARHAARAIYPVAAVQGDIKQTIKMSSNGVALALERYPAMTRTLSVFHPLLILWPETVINMPIGDDDALAAEGLNAQAARQWRLAFGDLARSVGTTLVVGSQEQSRDGFHNALYVYAPSGTLETIYRKRQPVPFAERLPAPNLLRPIVDRLGIDINQVAGNDPTVVQAGPLAAAPLICWESAFADLTHDQLARGANLLLIPTDDAWFGVTAGPYQHAQVAQMRAIESGTWVVRAGATGISGMIAPDGHWAQRLDLDRMGVVTGLVGPPAPTVFARIGPTPVALTLIVLYAAILAAGLRRTRSA